MQYRWVRKFSFLLKVHHYKNTFFIRNRVTTADWGGEINQTAPVAVEGLIAKLISASVSMSIIIHF